MLPSVFILLGLSWLYMAGGHLPWLAAAVGVILNLGVNFATHALWPGPSSRFDGFIALVAVVAFIAMQRFKVGLIPVIGGYAVLGLVWRLAF